MTSTPAWKDYYNKLQQMKKEHSHLILTEEKTREMIRHQEGIKVIDEIIDILRQPVINLNDYCNNMPLFAKQFQYRANFNIALGIVEVSEAF